MEKFEIHPNAISTEISKQEIRIRMGEIPKDLMAQGITESNFSKICEICIVPGQIEQLARTLIEAALICNKEYDINFDFLKGKGGKRNVKKT